MSFSAPADAYDRFMGRYSSQLAAQMADLAGVKAGQRVIDVGSGPGALTKELIARGAEVTAVDPAEHFVVAVRERFPNVDAQVAPAEKLPFTDDTFAAALAQLVVHFMDDPLQGIKEMARVTKPGGPVVACVWDLVGEKAPITPYWQAARELGWHVSGEQDRAGAGEGQLRELFRQAGLRDVAETALPVQVEHEAFEEWWLPFTMGVGPAGQHYQQLERAQQAEIEGRLREKLGEPVALDTQAWAARGTV